jgi:hypothetical protein
MNNILYAMLILITLISIVTVTIMVNIEKNVNILDAHCHSSDDSWVHFKLQTGIPQSEIACWNYVKSLPKC